MMRRIALVSTVLVPLAFAAGLAQEQTARPQPRTVEGVLVDMKCYSMDNSNVTNDHKTPKGPMPACATACAKMGIPVALLAGGQPGGELLALVAPVPPLSDHMAKRARVTGDPVLNGRGLIPSKVEVQGADGKWQEVKFATMM